MAGFTSSNISCFYLSQEELNALIAAGWRLVSGPYDTLDECEEFCIPEGGTGTGTGTNVLSTGVITPCCPSNGIPFILAGTIYNRTGNCTCLPDSVTLRWNGSIWLATIRTTCSIGFLFIDIGVLCSTNGISRWYLSIPDCGVNKPASPSSTQCSPFRVVWTDIACPGACTGTFDFSVSG